MMDRRWVDNGRKMIVVFVGTADVLFAVSGIEDAVTYSARDGGDSEAFLEFDLCHEGLWVTGYGLWVTGYG